MKKRIISAVMAVTTLFSLFTLSGCGKQQDNPPASGGSTSQSSSKPEGKKFVVGYATKRWSGSEHWLNVKEGMDEAVPDDVELIFYDAEGDLDTQVQQLETLIAQGVDGIICAPRDPDGVVPAFEQIREAGIALVTLDCSSSSPELEDTCVKMNYGMTGQLCAENLLKAIDYKGKVIVMYDFPNVEANERANGFKDVCAQYPDVELVEIDAFGTVDVSLMKLEAALTANPDTVAVWSYNTAGEQAAVSLNESMGLDLVITCVDCTSVEVENIREGLILGGAAQCPKAMGAAAIETMYEVLNGKTFDGNVLLDTEWVDASNVEEFAKANGL